MRSFTRADLARYACLSPAAMLACTRALARFPDARPHLARNSSLPSLVWRQLWSDRPAAADAIAMVSRHLSQPDREHVVSTDSRVKVLVALVEHNTLTPEEQFALARKAPAAVLGALVEQPWLDPRLRVELAVRLSGLALLREMALGPLEGFEDSFVADRLADFDSWMPEEAFKRRSEALKMLLVRRPQLLEAASRVSSVAVLTAVAGTLGVSAEQARRVSGVDAGDRAVLEDRRFALLALVSNPSVPAPLASELAAAAGRAGLEQVKASVQYRKSRPEHIPDATLAEHPDALSWLLHRALPSEYHDARTGDLLLLSRNPHLAGDDAKLIRLTLRDLAAADWRLQALLRAEAQFSELFKHSEDAAHAAHGPDVGWTVVSGFCAKAESQIGADDGKWDALVGLLEEFEGSPDELISVAASV